MPLATALLLILAAYLLGVAGGRIIAREHPEPADTERRTATALVVIGGLLLIAAGLAAL